MKQVLKLMAILTLAVLILLTACGKKAAPEIEYDKYPMYVSYRPTVDLWGRVGLQRYFGLATSVNRDAYISDESVQRIAQGVSEGEQVLSVNQISRMAWALIPTIPNDKDIFPEEREWIPYDASVVDRRFWVITYVDAPEQQENGQRGIKPPDYDSITYNDDYIKIGISIRDGHVMFMYTPGNWLYRTEFVSKEEQFDNLPLVDFVFQPVTHSEPEKANGDPNRISLPEEMLEKLPTVSDSPEDVLSFAMEAIPLIEIQYQYADVEINRITRYSDATWVISFSYRLNNAEEEATGWFKIVP